MAPRHLAPMLELLERTEREPVRAIVNVPPRHSKTESILHFIAYRLARRPWETIAYVTYGHSLAVSKSRLAREYALRSGIRLRDDASAVHEWRTQEMGGALFTSIGGAITGQGANCLLIDDAHKDRAEAESALHREAVWEWYTGTGYHRLEPNGSVIVTCTRWHPEDLTGRLLKEHAHENWEVVNLPALGRLDDRGIRVADDDSGDALWPEQWPREALLRKKAIDAYEWQSQFQQNPVGRGNSVFRGARFYTELPTERFRVGKGIDLASTARTRADFSVAVVLVEHEGLYYVVDVRRAQCEAPAFARELEAANVTWPSGGWHWFCSTTERLAAQLLTDRGVHVQAELATTDKFLRAGPVATAWNDGKILVPRDAPWLKSFLDELGRFTGVNDKHDDQIDALASAFESVRHSAPSKPTTVKGSEYRWGSPDRGFG